MQITLECLRCGLPFIHEVRKGRLPERCLPCRAVHKREQATRRQAVWKSDPDNREKARLYLHDWHQARKDDPEYRRARREAFMVYKYGLTEAQVADLIEAQGNRCAICNGERNGPGKRLHIDHCHDTGKVRGLLCGKCNTAVGLLDNDPERAEALARYLRKEVPMVHSPSKKWEDGVMVERAIETNRHRVLPDGTEIAEKVEVEQKATKTYKAPVTRKAVQAAENKAIKSAAKKS